MIGNLNVLMKRLYLVNQTVRHSKAFLWPAENLTILFIPICDIKVRNMSYRVQNIRVYLIFKCQNSLHIVAQNHKSNVASCERNIGTCIISNINRTYICVMFLGLLTFLPITRLSLPRVVRLKEIFVVLLTKDTTMFFQINF